MLLGPRFKELSRDLRTSGSSAWYDWVLESELKSKLQLCLFQTGPETCDENELRPSGTMTVRGVQPESAYMWYTSPDPRFPRLGMFG